MDHNGVGECGNDHWAHTRLSVLVVFSVVTEISAQHGPQCQVVTTLALYLCCGIQQARRKVIDITRQIGCALQSIRVTLMDCPLKSS